MSSKKHEVVLTTTKRVGVPRSFSQDFYHHTLRASWPALLGGIWLAYLAINGLFAMIYFVIPDGIQGAEAGSFGDCFFFSVHTFATIGYGSMSPKGLLTNSVVTVEAMIGMLAVAVVTGLIFAKFSRPSARIAFSKVAVIAKRNGVPTMMFRVANERSNQIVDATARLIMMRRETTKEGETMRRLYDLPLTRASTALLTLSWTVMSPIAEGHPLFGETPESLKASDVLFLVTVIGHDETISQTLHARYRYSPDEVRFGHQFEDAVTIGEGGDLTFEFPRLHDTKEQDSAT